jgi:hypothetical protein
VTATWEKITRETTEIAVLVEDHRLTFTWVRPLVEEGAFRWQVVGRLDI